MKMLLLVAAIAVGAGAYFHEDILETFEDASHAASSGGGGGGGVAGAMSEYGSSLNNGIGRVGSSLGR